MVYIVILGLALIFFYLLTFAKYNWSNNNKRATIGIILLALITFFFSSTMLILRR